MQELESLDSREFAGLRIELRKLGETAFVAFCPELGIKSFGQCEEQVIRTIKSEVLFELTKGDGVTPDAETLLMAADLERPNGETRMIYLPPKNTRH